MVGRTGAQDPAVWAVPAEAGDGYSGTLQRVDGRQATEVPDVHLFIPTAAGQSGSIVVELEAGDLPPMCLESRQFFGQHRHNLD